MVAKIWKNLDVWQMAKLIRCGMYIHITYIWSIPKPQKNSRIMSFVATWMDLEISYQVK